MIKPPPTILIDQRNFRTEIKRCADAVAAARLNGIDTEGEDSNRHAGLARFCKYRPDGTKPSNAKTVFDVNQMRLTGFSVYPENCDRAWYVNLGHADQENCVPWAAARDIIDAKPKGSYWLAHNGPFELMIFRKNFDLDLQDLICTLQMAVSAYGPDEYDKNAWINAGLGAMEKFVHPIMRESLTYDGKNFEGDLAEIVVKILAKESRATHSYNGFCGEHTFGYGLKKLVKSHFGYDMTTYEDVLNGKAHMGQLTGEETAKYGAEDAFWVVPTFHKLLNMMAVHAPKAMKTFFAQENPMIYTFADIWTNGVRINRPAVDTKRTDERGEYADLLRGLKAEIAALEFPVEPDARLMKREKWYVKSHAKYRKQITDWAKSPDSDDSFTQIYQVRGAVSKAWAVERDEPESNGVNLTHYMRMRTLLYDLIGAPIIMSKGKVQSNGEARGKIGERLQKKQDEYNRLRLLRAEEGDEVDTGEDDEEDETAEGDADLLVIDEIEIEAKRREHGIKIIDYLTKLSGSEQRMKLFLTPYVQLTDPDTDRMYPSVSSMLATRRMAASNPNPMQLQKRGAGAYVREFFLADTDEHIVGSIDWSGIELVIVGQLSGDPEFAKAFAQIPHEDLHSGTAASVLGVEVPLLTEEAFKGMKSGAAWRAWQEKFGIDCDIRRLDTNIKGLPLATPKESFKYWRNEVGKIANFNYWFSGWLGTVGEKMGWSMDQTAEAVNRFRDRFAVAEAWRLDTIQRGSMQGYIELLDGHRRNRWEATDEWMMHWLAKWPDGGPNFNLVIQQMGRKIQKRAWNQLVNAAVQGTCATLAKRSLIRIRAMIERLGLRARVMFPVHDELVFSVHKDDAAQFMIEARRIMCDHADLFPTLMLDASPAIGRNFGAAHKGNPYGQIELFEPPEDVVGKDLAMTRLDQKGMQIVVDFLFQDQQRMAA